MGRLWNDPNTQWNDPDVSWNGVVSGGNTPATIPGALLSLVAGSVTPVTDATVGIVGASFGFSAGSVTAAQGTDAGIVGAGFVFFASELSVSVQFIASLLGANLAFFAGDPVIVVDTTVEPVGAVFAYLAGNVTISSGGGSGASPADIAAWLLDEEAITTIGGTKVTMRQALRLMIAYMAGNVIGGPDLPQFKNLDGDKTVLGGTATPVGNRTRTVLDLS